MAKRKIEREPVDAAALARIIAAATAAARFIDQHDNGTITQNYWVLGQQVTEIERLLGKDTDETAAAIEQIPANPTRISRARKVFKRYDNARAAGRVPITEAISPEQSEEAKPRYRFTPDVFDTRINTINKAIVSIVEGNI